MKKPKFLVVVVGPTAVGKTALSIRLANKLKCDVVSADSRQFYKELEIGTAKPNADELKAAPHHLVNSLSIFDAYDVRQFEKEALQILETCFAHNNAAVLTGGSGLFVDALCHGLDDLPEVPSDIRPQLIKELEADGLLPLRKELKMHDPEYHEIVDLNNPQRVLRALEVIRGTGKTFSSFRTGKKADRPFNIIWIGLTMERQKLYQRIDQRMDQMIEQGLFEEAEKFYGQRDLNALQTVGYREIFPYLDGEYDKREAIRLLKRNSRRYAKRQLTWFGKNHNIRWFNPENIDSVWEYVSEEMKLTD